MTIFKENILIEGQVCAHCKHYGNHSSGYHIGICAPRGHLVVSNYDGPRCLDFSHHQPSDIQPQVSCF